MKNLKKAISFVISAVILLSAIVFLTTAATSKLNAVTSVSAKNSSSGIKISWKKQPQAKTYIVYRRTGGTDKYVKLVTVDAKKTSYTDKTAKPTKTYAYKIKAANGKTTSAYSKTVIYRFIKQPVINKISITSSGISLKWQSNPNADSYKLYRKVKTSDEWKLIATLKGKTKTAYTDKKVQSGKKYIYTLVSLKGNYRSAYSQKGKSKVFVAQPKGVSVKNSPKGVTLTWNKVKAATAYNVYRLNQKGSWSKIATVKGKTNYIDKSAAYGKTNSYKICAEVGSTLSAKSGKAAVWAINPNKKMVALTFDDGPYRPATNRILAALEKYNSHATFFVVGSRLTTYSDCLKKEKAIGCEIGNHTYNHTTLTKASKVTIQSEIKKTDDLVKNYTGSRATVLRAPGGSVNDSVRRAVDRPLINWSVDTLDWKTRSTSSTVAAVKRNVRDGSIVLMHDLYLATAQAAETIIPWLVNQGYQLVTVSEMMQVKGVEMQSGQVYYAA